MINQLTANAPLSVTDASGNDIANPSKLQAAMAGVREATTEMKEMGKDAFGSFAQGLGGIIEQFVLTGETGPQAMRKLAAGVLASVAAQAAVKSIFYLAEGIAAATNPFTAYMAPGYFTASAVMAGIAGGTAIVGRAVASGIRKEGQTSGAGNDGEMRDVTSESYVGNNFRRTSALESNIGRQTAQYSENPKVEYLLQQLVNKVQPVNGQQMVLATLKNNPREVARAAGEGVNGDYLSGNRLGQRIAN